MAVHLIAVILIALGTFAGVLSGRLPASGRAALAVAGLPLLGLYFLLPLC